MFRTSININIWLICSKLPHKNTQNSLCALNVFDLYKKELSQDVSHRANLAVLEYQLDVFTPHAVDHSFKNAIKALPAKTEEEVNNPEDKGKEEHKEEKVDKLWYQI